MPGDDATVIGQPALLYVAPADDLTPTVAVGVERRGRSGSMIRRAARLLLDVALVLWVAFFFYILLASLFLFAR